MAIYCICKQLNESRNDMRNEENRTLLGRDAINLYVIIKRNKGREQQAGEAYAKLLLTSQGQKAIEQAGFIPVRYGP